MARPLGKRPDAQRVIVYDTDGYLVGPAIAEQLAGEGFAVDYVSPFKSVAPSAWSLDGGILRRHLRALGVREHLETRVLAVSRAGVEIADPFDELATLDAAIVLVTQRLSEDGLYRDLVDDPDALAAAGIAGVHRVGDCVTPRWLADAVFDGHRLAREIDDDDPDVPRPYRREGFHDVVVTPTPPRATDTPATAQ